MGNGMYIYNNLKPLSDQKCGKSKNTQVTINKNIFKEQNMDF